MKKITLPSKYQGLLLERFLRYVRVHTTSSEDAPKDKCPSTDCQLTLARMLEQEMRELGAQEVWLSPFGYVYGTVHGNLSDTDEHDKALPHLPTIGLMSHIDTSSQASGENVDPQIFSGGYRGGDLLLLGAPLEGGLPPSIKVADNPALAKCLGHTLITSNGTTLLGADDKAGVAVLMTVMQYLIENSHLLHGVVRFCFNPDEEIGRGTSHLDLERFKVNLAYTADAGEEGEIEDECFSGRTATVTIKGVDIHPGYAFGKMVSAMRVFGRIMENLPEKYRPDTTQDKQPYIHPYAMEKPGSPEDFGFKALLRAFTIEELDLMERRLRQVCEDAQRQFPGSVVTVEVEVGYFNMKAKLDERPEVMQMLLQACEIQGITPIRKPIRGGTDGSKMTVDLGIPTPNVWAGGQNFHSVKEWASFNWMVSSVETFLQTVALWTERAIALGNSSD